MVKMARVWKQAPGFSLILYKDRPFTPVLEICLWEVVVQCFYVKAGCNVQKSKMIELKVTRAAPDEIYSFSHCRFIVLKYNVGTLVLQWFLVYITLGPPLPLSCSPNTKIISTFLQFGHVVSKSIYHSVSYLIHYFHKMHTCTSQIQDFSMF